MNRRQFLRDSTLGGAALLGLHAASEAADSASDEPRIKEYRTLGRTGMKVSDVSFGGGGLKEASLVERAIEVGINYFDTAPDYFPSSEKCIGEATKNKRDKVFIATKMCRYGKYPQHLDLHTPAATIIEQVEESLKRLQTDYVDVLFVHAVGERGKDDIERLKDPEMLKAFETLKKQGKARFLATSSHGAHRMEECLEYAVDCGHFDLIMASYNFMKFKDLQRVLEKAKAKNVGVVAMKTIPGAKATKPDVLEGLAGDAMRQAAVKWALSNPPVCNVVKGMKSFEDIRLFVGASGQKFTEKDADLLRKFASAINRTYCRTGCGECLDACPRGVPVSDILRYDMYYRHYGDEHTALQGYSQLPPDRTAAACFDCAGECEKACPYGLAVKDMLTQAHETLFFA